MGFFLKTMIKNIFGLDSNKILFSNHHVSHALTSVMYEHYNNNNINKDKLIIVADGVGDGECLSIYKMLIMI